MVQTLRRPPLTSVCNSQANSRRPRWFCIAAGYGRAKPGDPSVVWPHAKGALLRPLNLEHGASGIGPVRYIIIFWDLPPILAVNTSLDCWTS